MAGKTSSKQPGVDPGILEKRRRQAEELINGFNIDWINLLTGNDDSMSHATPELGQAIRNAVAPFLDAGHRIDPRFDAHAQYRLFTTTDGLTSGRENITGEVELTSRCGWLRFDGSQLLAPTQRLTIRFTLDATLTKVLDARFRPEDI